MVSLSCPPALLQHAVDDMLVRFLNAWPQVRLKVQATNRNVDVWQDGVDFAVRVRAQGSLVAADEVVRPLALSPHVLVCAPAVLTSAPPPQTPEDMLRLPMLGLGNSPEELTWTLTGPAGLAPSNGAQFGRFRNTWPAKDNARAVRRDILARVIGSPNAKLANGLAAPFQSATSGLTLGDSGRLAYRPGRSAWCRTYITCVPPTPAGS